MRELVLQPDFDDARQCAKRRALFFIRHLALWNELPAGTEWYELELTEANLAQIRVFPRAQWRKIAGGNFSISRIVECMSKHQDEIDDSFLTKIAEIGERLGQDEPGIGPVVLIGVNESEPLTILDGNHRLAGAILSSPTRVNKLRFLCGLSPRMMECCWYNTNFGTLFRYGRNVLKHGVVRRPKAELARLLQSSG